MACQHEVPNPAHRCATCSRLLDDDENPEVTVHILGDSEYTALARFKKNWETLRESMRNGIVPSGDHENVLDDILDEMNRIETGEG